MFNPWIMKSFPKYWVGTNPHQYWFWYLIPPKLECSNPQYFHDYVKEPEGTVLDSIPNILASIIP